MLIEVHMFIILKKFFFYFKGEPGSSGTPGGPGDSGTPVSKTKINLILYLITKSGNIIFEK